MLDIAHEVRQAEERIRAYIRETPLEESPFFSAATGSQVFLKMEHLQHTGSFKLRGALNKLLALSPAERARGVVAASSGNHGAAIAYGVRALGTHGIVFVPEDASPAKVAAIQRFGAEVRFHGADSLISEIYARSYAEQHGMAYISPYNDPQVIGGQGTIGVEIARQTSACDAVLVAVGGGGMIAGIAAYLKSITPGVKVIGCLPENSPVMAESVRAGRVLDMETRPTLSDGTAGGIEPGSITFDLCRSLVDEYVLVSEEEIRGAMRQCIESHHTLIEGAAGVAIAALLKTAGRWNEQRVVVVLCGANISMATLRTVIA